MADHVIVMKDGKVVEEGDTERIFSDPRDAYTQRLMSAALVN
jgi:oligopeptide transport system ATP-binding protein